MEENYCPIMSSGLFYDLVLKNVLFWIFPFDLIGKAKESDSSDGLNKSDSSFFWSESGLCWSVIKKKTFVPSLYYETISSEQFLNP